MSIVNGGAAMEVGLDREDVRPDDPPPPRRRAAAGYPGAASADPRAPVWLAFLAYVLLLAALIGLLVLMVLALSGPMILPALRLLTQQG